MALVDYLDWEVRTTGHDLNCSGFNPNRDPTNGVDYTQQDSAEVTSLVWRVDSSNNTWIRSADLENWGGTLVSLKGNHIHLAGMAIGGTALFSWLASSGKPGAYYLQALGGGNPGFTKPTRVWLNKKCWVENTDLPSGVDSWGWGDWDSLGYNTLYVRFGSESDANPADKNRDDVIADGKTWTRGVYEIINVGTDGNGKYLVLDRSPAATNSQNGYGRIGGAMYSPTGVYSATLLTRIFIWVRPGYYIYGPQSPVSSPHPGYTWGYLGNFAGTITGYDGIKGQKPSILPTFYITSRNGVNSFQVHRFLSIEGPGNPDNCYLQCKLNCTNGGSGIFIACDINGNNKTWSGTMYFCLVKNNHSGTYQQRAYFTIFRDSSERAGATGFAAGEHVNCVYYNSYIGCFLGTGMGIASCCIAMNCTYDYRVHGGGSPGLINCYTYGCTNKHPKAIQLPGNTFRDPDNGDFRLADNEAGRMLKQAGFQIPGPQGAPPMGFDAGAVQNSFYDIQGSGGAVLPLPMMFGA